MSSEDCHINKSSNFIPIPTTLNYYNAYNIDTSSQYCKHYDNIKYDEYSLKENFFNPNKFSPPNEWNLRLEYRLYHNNVNYQL